MTPVVAFVTFGVYRALHGELNLPSVFYALSLLHLPKLYLVYFAVIGKFHKADTKGLRCQWPGRWGHKPAWNTFCRPHMPAVSFWPTTGIRRMHDSMQLGWGNSE